MTQFKPYQEGIEVSGKAIQSMTELAGSDIIEILTKYEIANLIPDENHWYSQEKWLKAFKEIALKVGPLKLFLIGKKIIKTAIVPPMHNIEEALKQIDIAYHMNHRDAEGNILYNPNGKKILEGIGHYRYKKVNANTRLIISDSTYPCDFDRGVITGFANKFNPNAIIKHDKKSPCRKLDQESCTYIITFEPNE